MGIAHGNRNRDRSAIDRGNVTSSDDKKITEKSDVRATIDKKGHSCDVTAPLKVTYHINSHFKGQKITSDNLDDH